MEFSVLLFSLVVCFVRGDVYHCIRPQLQEYVGLAFNNCNEWDLLANFQNVSFIELTDKMCDFHINKSILVTNKNLTDPRRVRLGSYFVLAWVLEFMTVQHNDLFLEFGVAKGYSINATSMYRRTSDPVTIYGFDSFEGLPSAWFGLNKGRFTLNGTLPYVRSDVQLIKGLFHDTLPTFLKEHEKEKIGFVNIDNDIYEGTYFILEKLLPHLQIGSILHFHEMLYWKRSETGEIIKCEGNDELLAFFHIFTRHSQFKFEILPINSPFMEPVVFRVMDIVDVVIKQDS